MVSCEKAFWQIFTNLIDNSITHGFKEMESGLIHINITKEQGNIVINYQDNGKGINPKNRDKIFIPFYSSSRSKKHIGLGLNIVNNLVTNTLHGKIRLIESPIGLRFELIIPDLKDSKDH